MRHIRRPKAVDAELWLCPIKTPMKRVKRYTGAKVKCDKCDKATYLHGVFYAGQHLCWVCPGEYVVIDEDDDEMSTRGASDFINDYLPAPKP